MSVLFISLDNDMGTFVYFDRPKVFRAWIIYRVGQGLGHLMEKSSLKNLHTEQITTGSHSGR